MVRRKVSSTAIGPIHIERAHPQCPRVRLPPSRCSQDEPDRIGFAMRGKCDESVWHGGMRFAQQQFG